MPNDFTVFIVDDDAAVRDGLCLLLGLRGYRAAVFASSESFLQAWRLEWKGCLLLDIRMAGMDGLALQKHLQAAGCRMPVIIATGHGDVASACEAFKAHALDFLEKPFDEERLFSAIKQAEALQTTVHDAESARSEFQRLLTTLTPREREVLDLVVSGHHNREIAAMFAISHRTVEVHKARLMDKLQVNSVADLVRLAISHNSTG